MDADSRSIPHNKLSISLNGKSMATELQAALETASDARPRIVHDHGDELVNREVGAVIKTHNLIDINIKSRYPESNGTLRDKSDNDYGSNFRQANE